VTIILGGDSLNKTFPHQRTRCQISVLFPQSLIFFKAAAMSGATEWRLHWDLGLSFVVFFFVFSFIAKYFIFILFLFYFIYLFFVFILFYFILFLLLLLVFIKLLFYLFIYCLLLFIMHFFLFTALACIIIHIYHAYMLNRTSLKRVFLYIRVVSTLR
jgi:hypothetical protein